MRWLLLFLFVSVPGTAALAADAAPAGAAAEAPSGDAAEGAAPTGPARSAWIARVSRKPSEEGAIAGLTLSQSNVPVSLKQNSGRLRPLVAIYGRFERPGWKLYAQKQPLLGKLADPSEFALFLYLTARSSSVTLVAQGPKGELQSEDIVVQAPDAQEFRIGSQWGEIVAFLGGSYLSYSQTVLGDFTSQTALLSFYYTTPRWDWRLGGYADAKATIWTVASSHSGYFPQMVQAKADATWYLNSNPKEPIETDLVLGVNYLTLIANGSPFGFSNLITPEIGLRSFYPLGPDSQILGDLRYSPVAGILGWSDHGIDATLGWTRRLGNLHRVELDLCVTRYGYHPDSATTVSPNLYSLRFGYSI